MEIIRFYLSNYALKDPTIGLLRARAQDVPPSKAGVTDALIHFPVESTRAVVMQQH
jgi:hypothetical protein